MLFFSPFSAHSGHKGYNAYHRQPNNNQGSTKKEKSLSPVPFHLRDAHFAIPQSFAPNQKSSESETPASGNKKQPYRHDYKGGHKPWSKSADFPLHWGRQSDLAGTLFLSSCLSLSLLAASFSSFLVINDHVNAKNNPQH